MDVPIQISKATIALCSRRVRRKFIRAYLKLNKVPRPIFHKISDKINFNRLNQMTLIEDLKRDRFEVLPKMDIRGRKL